MRHSRQHVPGNKNISAYMAFYYMRSRREIFVNRRRRDQAVGEGARVANKQRHRRRL